VPYLNEVHLTPGGKITDNGLQAAAIADHADPSTASSTEIATKQNEILAVLRSIGVIKS
jgi:hypothetical protein